MIATILAAGVGSRLRPLTDDLPKCLVPVAGVPVLGWQLDALIAAGVRHIVVVAGYRAAQVVAFCERYRDRVRVVVNNDYERTNNMFSLRLALRDREAEPMFICNGDVVFDRAIPAGLAAIRDGDFIAVEPGRYIEESMKVVVDQTGRITGLSKAIAPPAAYGVSIDLYRFSAGGTAAIDRIAQTLIEKERQTNLWTEVAIEAALGEMVVRPFDIAGAPWIEIDTLEDLAEGQRLFSGARV